MKGQHNLSSTEDILICALFGRIFDITEQDDTKKEKHMKTRIAVIAIIIEDLESSEALNQLLHQYNEYVVGRMGIPYRQKQVSIVNVILDAPPDAISALSGKLGMLPGVSSKTVYSKQTL